MLVLTRKVGQSIKIDGGIVITVVGIAGRQAQIGIDAPVNVNIVRSEIEFKDMQFDG